MATDKQIAANRANAEHCMGPKTERGKANSSQNALKTGIDAKSEIIRYESPAEHAELVASFRARFNPATPEELSLVDALIRFEWLSRRYICADTAIWEHRFSQSDGSLAEVFLADSDKINRAVLLFNSVRRGFNATLKQLMQIQAARAAGRPQIAASQHPQSEEMPITPATIPEIIIAAEELNTELVSFLIKSPEDSAAPLRSDKPGPHPPGSAPAKEKIPPIAA